MEYSKEFVTSVVLGKDLVPRYVICVETPPISSIICYGVQLDSFLSCLSLIGLVSLSWRGFGATCWKSYRRATSQR